MRAPQPPPLEANLQLASPADGASSFCDADDEADWHAIAGVRLRRAQALLSRFDHRLAIHMVCVLMEPLRLLHKQFMYLANSNLLRGRKPALYTLGIGRAGLTTQVSQYFSSMLAGSVGRLRLIWMLRGHNSMTEWGQENPTEARLVRRVIFHLSSWVWRRLHKVLEGLQFKLLSLADAGAAASHECTIAEFDQTSACCMQVGFVRGLKQRGLAGQQLMGLAPAFWCSAASIRCSIAAVERTHARHRRFCRKDMPWHQFAAISVIDGVNDNYAQKKREREKAGGAPLVG